MPKELTFDCGSKCRVSFTEEKPPKLILKADGPLEFTYTELYEFADTLLTLLKLTPELTPETQ